MALDPGPPAQKRPRCSRGPRALSRTTEAGGRRPRTRLQRPPNSPVAAFRRCETRPPAAVQTPRLAAASFCDREPFSPGLLPKSANNSPSSPNGWPWTPSLYILPQVSIHLSRAVPPTTTVPTQVVTASLSQGRQLLTGLFCRHQTYISKTFFSLLFPCS